MRHGDTDRHAREVLATVDPDFRMVEEYRRYLEASPGVRRQLRDVESWCSNKIMELSGADSLDAAFEQSDIRTLMSFGYMGLSRQWRRFSLPTIVGAIPAIKELSGLEPDFFPQLVGELKVNAEASPSFARNLKAAQGSVTHVMARLRKLPKSDASRASETGANLFTAVVLIVSYLVVKGKK